MQTKEYFRAYYQNNKEKNAASTRAAQNEKRAHINKVKEGPCTDCGNTYPYYQMEFDHVRGKKLFAMGQAPSKSWDAIFDEIRKCELVCCMCHRERTHQRRLAKKAVG